MKIDREEMLRYLGFGGQQITPENERLFAQAEKLCMDTAAPRYVAAMYEYDAEKSALVGTDVVLGGEDVKRRLRGCGRVWLIAVTLGLEIDRLTARLMRTDAALGVALDSAAVCAVESFLDDVCAELASKSDAPLTTRFSCGYGDFPLEQQKDFVRLLDMNRKLGVFLGEGCLMTPMKSVTAVVGVCDNPSDGKSECTSNCANCTLKECEYRK